MGPTKHIIADTFLSRLLGIKNLKNPKKGQTITFPKCRAVHTFGIKHRLAIVFQDKDGNELKRINELKPWRIAIGPKKTTTTIEIIL